MGDAAADLVEALFQIGGDGEHVAGVAQRHLLAQVDAELVVVGRIERGDAPDALRPEPRAGAIGGAEVERNAEHRGVVLADIVDVLDIRRLEERVDAGEVRQLAARKRRNRLVGQAVGAGQAHVERPLPLLLPARARQFSFRLQRLPALGRHLVEIRMMPARPIARGKSARLARSPLPCLPRHLSCSPLGRFLGIPPGSFKLFERTQDGRRTVAVQVEIVGDRRAEALRRLRIPARPVERDQPRAQPERLLDVMRDHDDGHLQIAPQRLDQRMHLRAGAGIERAERLVEQQRAGPARQRLRDGETLLHAARQGAGILVAVQPEPDRLDHGAALVDRLAARNSGQPRHDRTLLEFVADQHVAEHGEMRKHRVALEHHAAIRPGLGGKRRAVEQHFALRRPFLAEDEPQERALARSGRTDHRQEAAALQFDVDALQHDLVAVLDPDVAKRQRAHQRGSCT